jgi:adenylate cyclase
MKVAAELSQERRRQTTVMFTDMVNYPTAPADETRALYLIGKQGELLRQVFAAHRGREIRVPGGGTEGTGLKSWITGPTKSRADRLQSSECLVEFTNAHDAMSCAVEVQRTIHEHNRRAPAGREIHLRVGIHVGEVEESEGETFGEGVSIASRIALLGRKNEIHVSGVAWDQVKNDTSHHAVRVEPVELDDELSEVGVYKLEPSSEGWSRRQEGEFDPKRLAVLPFANISPDPTDEYFADGLTEELIDRLCQVGDLEVIARTSIMSYKKKEKKIAEIARELGAGSIVEGSVRKAGNTIRVTAQLINGATEGHIWSSRYDRNLDDIFAVQTDIAEQVTDALKVRLLPREKEALQRKATESTEAYTLYLKGRYFWNERTKGSLEKAVRYFTKALEKDPRFALAYAGLADSYTIMLDRGYVSGKDFSELNRKNAERALEIDGSLAEAHLALGGVFQHTFEWSSAEAELKKALELNPSLAQAHHWLGVQYSVLDRWDEGVEELKRAIELDPLSKLLKGVAAYDVVLAGRVDEGMKMAEEQVEEHPDEYWGHLALSLACFRKSQNEKAVEEAKKAYSQADGQPWPMAFLLYILRETGKLREAEETARSYLNTDGTRPWSRTHLAMVHLVINDTDKAFELLNEAYERSDPALIYIGWQPIFDSVRSDPRYLELLGKVKPR